ncbi:unnamed protein product, partial [Polarella glacialis]
ARHATGGAGVPTKSLAAIHQVKAIHPVRALNSRPGSAQVAAVAPTRTAVTPTAVVSTIAAGPWPATGLSRPVVSAEGPPRPLVTASPPRQRSQSPPISPPAK